MVESGVIVACVVIVVGGIYWWLKRRLSFWKHRGMAHVKPRLLMGNLHKKQHIAVAIAECYTKLKVKAHIAGFYFLQRSVLLPLESTTIQRILTVDKSHFNVLLDRKIPIAGVKSNPAVVESTLRSLWHRFHDIAHDITTNLTQNHKEFEAFEAALHINVKFLATCYLNFPKKEQTLRDLEDLARKHLKPSSTRFRKFILRNAFPTFSQFLEISEMDGTKRGFSKLLSGHIRPGRGDKRYRAVIQLTTEAVRVGQQQQSKKIDSKEITMRAFGLFIAGIEASVATMAFCMYELAKSQEIQSMVRREIRHILTKNHQHITYDALAHMKFMDAVIFETLRKYPPIGSTWRVTSKEYHVPNTTYIIERGIPIILPIYAIHHDPQHHTEPEIFNPQRFKTKNFNEGTFLPFARSCTTTNAITIEMHFALMQIKLMLVTILKEFRIISHHDDFSAQADAAAINPKSPTLTPKNNIWLQLEHTADL
ncbi:hypothetical protein DMENIID0001_019280 [Sergentomyia squamirostris]